MVQVSERVGTAQKGSIKAVAGSGMASMSEASMDFQPRMEEPSKPRPSVNTSSVSSEVGTLKCCQVPKVSTNLMSTILAPCCLARSMAALGVPGLLPLLMGGGVLGRLIHSATRLPCRSRLTGRDYRHSLREARRGGYA